jgi:hypothetical protein
MRLPGNLVAAVYHLSLNLAIAWTQYCVNESGCSHHGKVNMITYQVSLLQFSGNLWFLYRHGSSSIYVQLLPLNISQQLTNMRQASIKETYLWTFTVDIGLGTVHCDEYSSINDHLVKDVRLSIHSDLSCRKRRSLSRYTILKALLDTQPPFSFALHAALTSNEED